MNLVGSSFFTTMAGPPTLPEGGTGGAPIIVWLQGEHDLSTDDALCMTLARAIALDGAGLVLDLSEVSFIAVSTLRVIVRAQEFLQDRLRSLTVRSPSPCARRAIRACGLDELLGAKPEELSADLQGDTAATALRTWVEVPAGGRPTTKVPEGEGRLARSGR
jgi:anti-anti-sigma factor